MPTRSRRPTIGAELAGLFTRAAESELHPSELTGATFTVVGSSEYDIVALTPLILPPQAGALAYGPIRDAPVVRDGEVVPGHTMQLSLAVDHRIVYGHHAAAFLGEVKAIPGGGTDMTDIDVDVETLAQRIADRGQDALVRRLRTAYADAAAAHADLISLDDEQIEAMVQSAAESADGLQWRRALAEVAADELGVSVTEALTHPAVARAQALVGAPSYEQSLAEMIARPVPPPAPQTISGTPAAPAPVPEPPAPEPEPEPEPEPPMPGPSVAHQSVSAADSELPATDEHQSLAAAEAAAPAPDELETVEADDVDARTAARARPDRVRDAGLRRRGRLHRGGGAAVRT